MNTSRILYVDDELDLVQLASAFFEEEGMPIDSCTCLKEALKLIRANKYDVIISDSRMPSGTGKELLTTIKSEGLFEGKFVLVTGNLDFCEGEEEKLYDMVMYKPIRFNDLIEKVKGMLLVEL